MEVHKLDQFFRVEEGTGDGRRTTNTSTVRRRNRASTARRPEEEQGLGQMAPLDRDGRERRSGPSKLIAHDNGQQPGLTY